MEQVESGNVEKRHSGQITECLGDTLVFLVDYQGSFSHGVTTVPDLTNTCPYLWVRVVRGYILNYLSLTCG